eukprot:SAG22_NODE_429_length_10587_cov_22.842582_4_plen_169_part_00
MPSKGYSSHPAVILLLSRLESPLAQKVFDRGAQTLKRGMAVSNAFPELERELEFVPLGVENPKVLTRAQINTYNENGFVAPITVFTEEEMLGFRSYFDQLLPQALAAGWDSYEITNWHKYCRGVWDLVMQPRLLDLVSDMLGDTVICRHSHFFAKLAHDDKRVSMHQE